MNLVPAFSSMTHISVVVIDDGTLYQWGACNGDDSLKYTLLPVPVVLPSQGDLGPLPPGSPPSLVELIIGLPSPRMHKFSRGGEISKVSSEFVTVILNQLRNTFRTLEEKNGKKFMQG
jgi:hypothetical protein